MALTAYIATREHFFVASRDPPRQARVDKTTPGELKGEPGFPYLQLFIGDLSRIIAIWENIIADFDLSLSLHSNTSHCAVKVHRT